MASKHIEKKVTDSNIEVLLFNTTVIKRYRKNYICMISFSTKEEAKKEFGKYRQGYRKLR